MPITELPTGQIAQIQFVRESPMRQRLCELGAAFSEVQAATRFVER